MKDKAKAKALCETLEKTTDEEKEKYMEEIEGKQKIVVDVNGEKIELEAGMVKIERVEQKILEEKYVPKKVPERQEVNSSLFCLLLTEPT